MTFWVIPFSLAPGKGNETRTAQLSHWIQNVTEPLSPWNGNETSEVTYPS